MAKRPLEDGTRYDFRVGKGQFAFGGMMQDPDPGAPPPNRPQLVVNGRFQGGGIVSRPPYVPKVYVGPNIRTEYTDPTGGTTTQTMWEPKFIAAHSPQTDNELWTGYFDNTAGAVISRSGWTGDPTSQDLAEFPTLIQRANHVARWNGNIYVGDQGHLKRIYRLGDDGAGNNIALGSLPPDETIYTFPNSGGSQRHVRVLHAHDDGKLYMLVDDSAGVVNTLVYSFDGSTLVEEYDFGAIYNTGGAFATINSKLACVARSGGDDDLRLRDTDGSWSTVTSSGNMTFNGYINGMTSCGPYLYIACGSNGWFEYDDTAGTLVASTVSPASTEASDALAQVACTVGDRAFLCNGNVYNAGVSKYLEITMVNARQDWVGYWLDSAAPAQRFTFTAVEGVGRRIQAGVWLGGNFEPGAGAGTPYHWSFGDPGATIGSRTGFTIFTAGLQYEAPTVGADQNPSNLWYPHWEYFARI